MLMPAFPAGSGEVRRVVSGIIGKRAPAEKVRVRWTVPAVPGGTPPRFDERALAPLEWRKPGTDLST
jgi:hypothetical protein